MAEADNVLGISGQMDISKIEQTIDELNGKLNSVGIATDQLSERASQALNKIEQSSASAASKQQQAIQVLKQVNEEVGKLVEGLPDKIRAAQTEMTNISASIAKIRAEMDKATDSKSIAEYTSQLKAQSAAYDSVKASVTEMQHIYDSANSTVANIANSISTANGLATANNAATTAGAVAHGATAAAVTAEVGAHTANAESIAKEGDAKKTNTEATKESAQAQQDENEQLRAYTAQLSDIIQKINETQQKISDLKSAQGELNTDDTTQSASIQKQIDAYERNLEVLKQQKEELQEGFNGNFSDYQKSQAEDTANTYAQWREAAQSYADSVDNLRERISELLAQYEQLPDANENLVEKVKNDMEALGNNPTAKDFLKDPSLQTAFERLSDNEVKLQEAVKNRSSAETEANTETKKGLEELNAELDNLLAKRKEIIGNVPNWLAEWNPNGIFEFDDGEKQKLDDVNEAIRQKKEEIREAQEEIKQLNEEEEKASNPNTYGQQQMSVSQLREEIAKTTEELAKLNAKQEELSGKEPTKKTTEDMKKLGEQIEDTKKKQEALNHELEGRSAISKGWASIKDSIKGVGDSIKSTFSSIKGGFAKGEGGISGIFSLLTSTKVLGWGAAIGAVGGAVKGLTDEAESLRISLNGLAPYMDADKINELKESFINTALQGSAQSTQDMAQAAAHWVRYYEQIRKTPAAIQEVVDASRDLATLTGQSAEKSADALTKIAGQYHLNAFEAKNAVNVIANATVKSTVSMTEMMNTLQSTGQRAKQMGTSFKEMAAVIAMSSQNFPSASAAASSYLMVLQRLSRQTKDEYNPLVVGATKALENLNKAHLSGAEIQKMFGVRIANQARYFIQNGHAIAKYTQGLDSASGKNKALARATQTAEYNQKALKNALGALAQAVNLNITPAITGFIRVLTSLIAKFTTAIQPIKNFFNTILKGIKDANNWIQSTWAGKLVMRALTNNPIGIALKFQIKGAEAIANASKPTKQERGQQLNDRIDELYGAFRAKYPKASQNAITNMIKNNLWDSKKRGNWGDFYYGDIEKAAKNKVAANETLYNANINGFDFEPSKDNHVDPTNKTKKNTAAEQQNRRDEQLAKERFKKEQENAKIEQDLANLLEQNKIDAMSEGAAKQRRQSDLDHKKRLQQIKEQAQQYVNANIEAANAEYTNKHPSGKNKGFYTLAKNSDLKIDGLEGDIISLTNPQGQTIGLNDKQSQMVQAQIASENLKFANEEKKLEEQLIQAHQSFVDKKLAIDKKYKEDLAEIDAAIASAQQRGDQDQVDALQRSRREVEKQHDSDSAKLTYQSISAGIDWKALFSGVENLSKEMLQPMLEQLKAYTKTDEYANADSQTQKDVVGLIEEIGSYIATDNGKTYEDLSSAIVQFTSAITEYNQKRTEEDNANNRLGQADSDLRDGKITQADYDNIKREAAKASDATAKARENVQKFGNQLNDTADEVAKTPSKLEAALKNSGSWKKVDGFGDLDNASKGLGQFYRDLETFKGKQDSYIKNNQRLDDTGYTPEEQAKMNDAENSKSIANALQNGIGKGMDFLGQGIQGLMSKGIGQVIGFVAQIPKLILNFISAIKNFVTGVLNSFSELLSFRWLDDLVVSILDAIGNLINTILDLPENLYHVLEAIVVKGVGGLLNTILGRLGNILTLGALSSKGPADWFTNSNAKEVADTISRLTDANKTLEKSIDDLKDTIKKTTGASAINASDRAIKLQEEANENYKKIAEAQAGYHGHHHSWNKYWNGFSDAEIDNLNSQFSAAGYDSNWTGYLFDLSPEQMKILRSNVDIWQRILDTGKGDYGHRLGKKLDDYINQAGKLEEITDQLNETLTTTTKENVFDDFINSLDELASGSQDVFDEIADNWQKMVNKMVVNNIVGARFKEQLDSWYASLANLNKKYTNKEISDSDYKKGIDDLKSQYTGYVQDAQSQIEQLRDMGIIQNTGEYSQNATSKGVSSITYDQANLLVNLATARNIALEQGNQMRQLIQVDTTQIRVTTMQMQSDISVMRDIQEQGLTQITRIEANTRPISEILSTVQEMYRLQRENA